MDADVAGDLVADLHVLMKELQAQGQSMAPGLAQLAVGMKIGWELECLNNQLAELLELAHREQSNE